MKGKKGKIAVVAVAGAITGINVWVIREFAGIVVPPEVGAMIQVVVVAVVQAFLPDEMEG